MRWLFGGLFAVGVGSGCGAGTIEIPEVGEVVEPPPAPVTPPTSDPPPDPTPVPDGTPTWYQDIAPLLADRCAACHIDGGVGPFSVETYEEARIWGPSMANSIEMGTMPPFDAVDQDAVCDMPVGFLEDTRLSDADKQLFYDWIEADMPEGDPATAAPAPLRPIDVLSPVDLEVTFDEPFTVSGDQDIYQCFRVQLPNNTDKYLTGIEVVPDNDLVVHHVLVWNDPHDNSAGAAGADGTYGCSGLPDIFPTELVTTWTPGAQPTRAPEGTATLIEAGASLVVNVHYHPTGTTTELDSTRLRLQWTDDQPDMYATWFLIDQPFGARVLAGPNDDNGPEFKIPAGIPDHQETLSLWFWSLLFSADMEVFAITPHMHYLGSDMLVTIEHNHDENESECLVHSPTFRFDWQRSYLYDPETGERPVIHRNDTVKVTCEYDNSMSNPYMPLHLEASGRDAPADVYWGEYTGDEMCMAMVGLIVPTDGWSPFSWF